MKKWPLICGAQYYPSRGVGDWIGTFETSEDAESMIVNLDKDYISEPCKSGKIVEGTLQLADDKWSNYSWYSIINLEEWMK